MTGNASPTNPEPPPRRSSGLPPTGNPKRTAAVLVALVAVLATLVGATSLLCAPGAQTPEDDVERRFEQGQMPWVPDHPLVQEERGPTPSYFNSEKAATIGQAFSKALEQPAVLELTVRTDFAIAWVVDRKRKARYELRDGSVSRESDSPLTSSSEDVGEQLIHWQEIDTAIIPRLVAETRKTLDDDDAVIGHVNLRRDLPLHGEPRWTVVTNDSDVVVFSLAGELLEGRTADGRRLTGRIKSFINQPEEVKKILEQRFGATVELTQLEIGPERASIDMRDPRKPRALAKYDIAPGSMSPGRTLHVWSSLKKDLDACVVRLDSIDFTLVPKLADDAQKRLGYEKASVDRVIFTNRMCAERAFRWRVHVSGDGRHGHVWYDLRGGLVEVSR